MHVNLFDHLFFNENVITSRDVRH